MTSKKTTQKEDNKKAKWNNSTLFLSPMFESILRGRQLHGFCSLYLGDHEHNTQHKNAIYALFKPNFTARYMDFEKKLKRNPLCIDSYDVSHYSWGKLREVEDHVMFVLEIPKEHLKDYKKFIQGKYSEFSSKYKSKFQRGTNTYAITHKSKRMVKYWEDKLDVVLPKESEVWSIWNPEEEIYRYNSEMYP